MSPEAYSISAFCEAHGISRGSYYNLKKAGKAPREMHVGNRVLVSKEAAADWRRVMETAASEVQLEPEAA